MRGGGRGGGRGWFSCVLIRWDGQLLPERDVAGFAAGGFGKFGYELDFARVFVGGDESFTVGLELGFEVFGR